MAKNEKESTLDILHEALAEDLLARVKSGEATHHELKVVADFLKQNNISSNTNDSKALKAFSNEIELDEEYVIPMDFKQRVANG
jgi:hypothetical protein